MKAKVVSDSLPLARSLSQSVKAKVADAYIDHKLEKAKAQISGKPPPGKPSMCSVCGCGKSRK